MKEGAPVSGFLSLITCFGGVLPVGGKGCLWLVHLIGATLGFGVPPSALSLLSLIPVVTTNPEPSPGIYVSDRPWCCTTSCALIIADAQRGDCRALPVPAWGGGHPFKEASGPHYPPGFIDLQGQEPKASKRKRVAGELPLLSPQVPPRTETQRGGDTAQCLRELLSCLHFLF